MNMKKSTETFPEESNLDDSWHEEKPAVSAYRFGERIDPKDKTRDYYLCPECGMWKKSIDLHSKIGEMRLGCPKGHEWIFDSKTNTIEDVNKRIEFPQK